MSFWTPSRSAKSSGHSAQALQNAALVLYERCAAAHQLRERSLGRRWRNIGVELVVLTCDVSSDDLGVDPVGLAAAAKTLRITAQVPRVHDEYL